jgi:hypothetical protein
VDLLPSANPIIAGHAEFVLVHLIEHDPASMARVAQQQDAIPLLVRLLNSANPVIARNAAFVLAKWNITLPE